MWIDTGYDLLTRARRIVCHRGNVAPLACGAPQLV